jgi:hypothetical protein
MCSKHWYALPQMLREDLRKGTEKGAHSLRATPTREWLAAASKHVGDIKCLNVRVDAHNRFPLLQLRMLDHLDNR